nr:immunoglobulin light chain junction region [Macaca mulatta]MOV75958.1 immunoglobulin light chain junction region [Macaca mulatta]MOV76124.1 immunoglobulin light chain junction region [Macaca mulatta]
CLQTKNSRTF